MCRAKKTFMGVFVATRILLTDVAQDFFLATYRYYFWRRTPVLLPIVSNKKYLFKLNDPPALENFTLRGRCPLDHYFQEVCYLDK